MNEHDPTSSRPADFAPLASIVGRIEQAGLSAYADSRDPRRYFAQALHEGLTAFLTRDGERTRKRAIACLSQLLEDLAARVRATCGWLFVPDNDQEPRRLRSIASFRAADCRVRLDQQSIVGHVFETAKSYIAFDTLTDAHFLEVVPGIRSAIAIPIQADLGDGPRLLAVLHYESLVVNAFNNPEQQELERLANLFVLPLLVWRRARAVKPDGAVFDPHSQGWGIEPLYAKLLKTLVRLLDRQGKAMRPALALWTYDRQKKCAWCVAAEGYGREYLHDVIIGKTPEGLPCVIQSVCESSQQGDPNGIALIDPRQHPQFIAKETVRLRDVRAVAYIPVHWLEDGASCVLAVYFFQNVGLWLEEQTREQLVGFSRRFHHLVSDLRIQRRDLAIAHLLHRLAIESANDPCRVHALRQALEEVFQAAVATISGCFVSVSPQGKRSRKLTPLSTTHGFVPTDARSGSPSVLYLAPSDASERFTLDLDNPDHQGVTTWLACHPGATDRRLNLLNNDEARPNGSPPATLAEYREYPFVRGDEPRRYLGGSVVVDGQAVFVVRLMRVASEASFRESDEQLLRDLLARPEVIACARGWTEAWQRAHERKAPSTTRPPRSSRGPQPASVLPKAPVRHALGEQLRELYGRVTGEAEAVRARAIYLHRLPELLPLSPFDQPSVRLKAYAQYPPPGSAPQSHHGNSFEIRRAATPTEHTMLWDLSPLHEALAVVGTGRPLGPELDLLPESHRDAQVRFARVPILVWGEAGPTQMILSLVDTQTQPSLEDLRQLLSASLDIASVFADALDKPLPDLRDSPWRHVQTFLRDALRTALEDDSVDVRCVVAGKGSPGPRGPRPSEVFPLVERSQPFTRDVLADAEHYGLRVSRDQRTLLLPLRAGAVIAGEVSWGYRPNWRDRLPEAMRLLNAWSTAVFRGTEGHSWEFDLAALHTGVNVFQVWRPTVHFAQNEANIPV